MKKLLISISFILVLAVMVAPLQADPINPDADWFGYITSDHATNSLGTPPFGEVALWQNGDDVDFEVNLYNGNQFVLTGALSEVAFAFSGVDVSYLDITGANAMAGSFGVGSTGYFDIGVWGTSQTQGGGISAWSGPLVFTVADATIADLTQPNSYGNIFLVDILSGTTGATGVADVNTRTQTVPEPSLLLLLGLGLGAVSLVSRRKK